MMGNKNHHKYCIEEETPSMAADPVVAYMSQEELAQHIQTTRKKMEAAAQELKFMEAAGLRDEIIALEKALLKY